MKTVDELLAVVQAETQKQNARAVQLFGSLQSLDGYDMGGGFKLLTHDGKVLIAKDGKEVSLAAIYWESIGEREKTLGLDGDAAVSPLDAAFNDIGLFVDIYDATVIVDRQVMPLKGLVVSWFQTKAFGRDDLEAALEYLFSYVAAVKQKIRDR